MGEPINKNVKSFNWVNRKLASIMNNVHDSSDGVNIGCNRHEKKVLMLSAYLIHRELTIKVPIKYIQVAVIFTYYALNLQEQTTDFLYLRHVSHLCGKHYAFVKQLHWDICVSDKPLYSAIRRQFFGMPPLITN
jgi:hypothetical protein